MTTLSTKRKPYSILMSEAERTRAQALADIVGISVPELIRLSIDSDDLEKKLIRIKKKHLDRQDAAAILAKLGEQRYASNLNQLAREMNTGTLVWSVDAQNELLEACEAVLWMRDTLIRMQGLKL